MSYYTINEEAARRANDMNSFRDYKAGSATAEYRLQIIFDGKPNADVRTELKGEGFRWAPSQGAWQRQLTDNAMRAARRLKCIAPQV